MPMMLTGLDPTVRLRSFDEADLQYAKKWYADPVVLAGVISPEQKESLSVEFLNKMYRDLKMRGDLYIIEVSESGIWLPIGDVTLAKNALPIVVGDPVYRGRKIGFRVVNFLVAQSREKGWERIRLKGIYKDNLASQRLFESCGFQNIGETSKCCIYELVL